MYVEIAKNYKQRVSLTSFSSTRYFLVYISCSFYRFYLPVEYLTATLQNEFWKNKNRNEKSALYLVGKKLHLSYAVSQRKRLAKNESWKRICSCFHYTWHVLKVILCSLMCGWYSSRQTQSRAKRVLSFRTAWDNSIPQRKLVHSSIEPDTSTKFYVRFFTFVFKLQKNVKRPMSS